jgi:acyl carrier protein
MTNENDIDIDDEELEEDSEFITAGQLAEYVDQEFVEDEIVSYHIYSKSDVESELGVEITDEQWIKFLRLWENDEVLNEVRAETWMQAVGTLREELGIEEEDDES